MGIGVGNESSIGIGSSCIGSGGSKGGYMSGSHCRSRMGIGIGRVGISCMSRGKGSDGGRGSGGSEMICVHIYVIG